MGCMSSLLVSLKRQCNKSNRGKRKWRAKSWHCYYYYYSLYSREESKMQGQLFTRRKTLYTTWKWKLHEVSSCNHYKKPDYYIGHIVYRLLSMAGFQIPHNIASSLWMHAPYKTSLSLLLLLFIEWLSAFLQNSSARWTSASAQCHLLCVHSKMRKMLASVSWNVPSTDL